MSRIDLRGVGKQFGAVKILNDITLTIDPGEFCVFIGPSGCGKSTLLRLIAGLEDASRGEIEIDGVVVNDMPPAQRNVAMVFQSYALYPHMTVHENMAFGLRHQKLAAAEIERRVAEASRILHLEGLLQRRPRELSGGQRQRVAIGRAIVRKPKVFLFDEPLSNLDAALRVQTRVEIAKLHRELGSASMVYVTHDQIEAMTLADKIVLLQPLAGRSDMPSVAQVGHPLELYHHPANRFVAGFIGSPSMNFIDARITELHHGRVLAAAPHLACEARLSVQGLEPGEEITLGVRPEHVLIGQGTQRARVNHVERLGEASYVYLDLPGAAAPLLAKTARDDIAIDDEVPFTLPAEAMHLFRADGLAQPREGGPARAAS
ncbi:MAG TPA: sn-glycerol-3-phosphate ABC transporter ATP-binding protein UgpC [Albitalea sp.]|nr:sn-glycerol-3-phosphate ABC transporter ATP-binding protein UgpC [Albitalea sp.]